MKNQKAYQVRFCLTFKLYTINMFKYVKLGDLAEFRNGLNFSKSSTGLNVKIIGVTDFKSYLTPNYSNLEEITIDGSLKEEDYVQNGDIIFVRSNGNKDLVGRSLYIDRDSTTSFSGFCIRLRFTSSDVLPKYFAFYTKSDYFKKSISKGSLGTNINNLNQGILSDVLVPLPSVERQKTVLKILESITDKIELNNKINAELESMAKLIYDYWFVQFDFPISKAQAAAMGNSELEGKPYKTSGGPMVYNQQLKREIPEGWEIKELKTQVAVQRGISYKSSEINDDQGIPMINLNSFKLNGTYKPEGIKIFSGKYTEKHLLKDGDLLIALTDVTRNADIIGKALLVPDFYEDLVCSMDIAKIIPTGSLTPTYLMMLFNSDHYHNYIKWYASGTLVLHLNLDGMNWYKAEIPPNSLLEKYDELFNGIRRRINETIKQNQKLSELRDWLLPMLMNGQVSIKEAEEYADSYRESMAAEPEEKYGDQNSMMN